MALYNKLCRFLSPTSLLSHFWLDFSGFPAWCFLFRGGLSWIRASWKKKLKLTKSLNQSSGMSLKGTSLRLRTQKLGTQKMKQQEQENNKWILISLKPISNHTDHPDWPKRNIKNIVLTWFSCRGVWTIFIVRQLFLKIFNYESTANKASGEITIRRIS